MENNLNKMILPEYVLDILKNSNRVIFPESREELIELSFGDSKNYQLSRHLRLKHDHLF